MDKQDNKPGFSSARERRLWVATLLAVVTIYATLGLARTLADILRDRDLVEGLFIAGFALVVLTVVVLGLRTRPGIVEIGVAIGFLAIYFLTMSRLGIQEERTHLFEYAVVAALSYQALLERRANGRRTPAPALLAFGLTALLGWLDEGIQWILPNRVYDIRDVGFNALAALMAVVAIWALMWARRWQQARRCG